MTLPPLIAYSLSITTAFKYPVAFLGAFVEGPIVMIACGFLIRQGYFNIFYIYIALVLGDLLGDMMWYFIGFYFADAFIKRFGHFVGLTPEVFQNGKNLFKKYHVKILLISKLTLGLGMALATLMAAGATKISVKTVLFLNTVGELVLVAFMLAIGYFFGQLYDSIAGGFKIAFIVVAVLFVGAIGYGFSRYMKTKILS